MDKSKEKYDSEPSKRNMVSLSKAAHTKIKELNKADRKEMGRSVTLAETIERRVL